MSIVPSGHRRPAGMRRYQCGGIGSTAVVRSGRLGSRGSGAAHGCITWDSSTHPNGSQEEGGACFGRWKKHLDRRRSLYCHRYALPMQPELYAMSLSMGRRFYYSEKVGNPHVRCIPAGGGDSVNFLNQVIGRRRLENYNE